MSYSTQELLDAAWQHFDEARPLIPMYIHLLLAAIFPIYAGAHASLSRPASAAKPDKKDEESEDQEEDEEEEETVQQMEGLSPQDAIVFPVTAAMVLAGLYFLIQRFGADMINLILSYYFAGVGIYSVGRLVNDILVFLLSFVFPTYLVKNRRLLKVNSQQRKYVNTSPNDLTTLDSPSPMLPPFSFLTDRVWTLRAFVKQKYSANGYIKDFLDFEAHVTVINLMSAVLGIVSIVYAHLSNKPWWLSNLQGVAVCYSAFQLMSPTTFATGSLVLSGLFFYDIWAVFFTPLMVTVAKNIDQPIKLVFPRPEEPPAKPGEPPTRSYSMLGLGDIVLPGLMIALALRFDLYLFYLRKQTRSSSTTTQGSSTRQEAVKKATCAPPTGGWGNRCWTWTLPSELRPDHLKSFPKPYFTASITGYVLGMLTTLAVMSVFRHAQPALLYLVPGVLVSLWSCALVRGEIKEMWNYTEAITGGSLEDDGEQPEEEGEGDGKDDGRQRRPGESWPGYIWRSVVGGEDAQGSEQKTEAEEMTGEASEKVGKSREGVIFAFQLSELTAGKSSPGKKEKSSGRTSKQIPASENSDDGEIVVSSADYEPVAPGAPATRSRSTRRRKA